MRKLRGRQDGSDEAVEIAPWSAVEGESAAASKYSDQRAAELDGSQHLGFGTWLCMVGLYSAGRNEKTSTK